MLPLSIYRYIFVSVGLYCLPLAWSFNLFIFYIPISSIFSSFFVCFYYLCLPMSSFFCRSAFCLCLQEFLIFSCLFIFVFYIFSSAFCHCPPLSIVLLFYDWPLFCVAPKQWHFCTVYTYLLPGHLVVTEDDADPASPFYIVIRTCAQ
jgi:hypothetical protein